MLLKNCKIVTSKEIITANILIEDGKIVDIGKTLGGEEAIDVKGKPVIPGLVDVHVHMRDFEERYKEDFFSGSAAALAGGVTTFVDMPNSKPPVVDEITFRRRINEAERKCVADFGLNFGVTQQNFGEFDKVDPVAYKIYMDGTLGNITEEMLEKAIQKCSRIAIHAEDAKIIQRNAEYLKDEEDFLAYCDIREPGAEELAVKKVCELANKFKKRIHICHISHRKSLDYLNEYTTCEATPHHLLLSDKYLKEFGGIAKTNPPLRSLIDVKTLREALKAGRIDIIASDHAPHAGQEKEGGLSDTPSGMPNLDIMLRLFLTLVYKKIITLNALVKLMCENPARMFGIKNKGGIKIGNDADIVILDMNKKATINVDEFYSKAKYSPFEGWKTTGSVEKVILRGEVAFEDGEICVKKGYGKRVKT